MCVLALCACVRLCTHTRTPAPVAQVYALPDLTLLPFFALGDEVEMLNEEAAQATQATECSYEGPTSKRAQARLCASTDASCTLGHGPG